MKTVKLLSLSLLASMALISCKKENKEQVLEEPKEVDYAFEKVEDSEENTPAVDPTTAPVLVLDQESYDFGDVKAEQTTEKVITFRNEGKGPLIIKDAKASCGCTVPEYSKEPVAVGEEGKLTVKYSAPAYNGHVSKTVTLTTNTVEGEKKFKITANVVGGKDRDDASQNATASQPAPNL